MAAFTLAGLLAGGSPEAPTMLGTIANTTTGVTLIDHGNGTLRSYDATGNGLAGVGAVTSLGARVGFSLFGQAVSLAGSVIDAALAGAGAGDTGSDRGFLSPIESQANAATLLAATVSGTAYLFVAPQDGTGLASYAVTGNGTTLALRGTIADTETSYAANVSALSVVKVGGTTYLLAGSATEHGVTCYSVAANGTLTEVDSFGRAESLPLQTVSAMGSTVIDGTGYVVVASHGSSSLTVLQVQPGGTLAPAEHVVDSTDTRFSGVSALEVVDLGGERSLVIAGGNDGGLTTYTLLPDGHLLPGQVIEGSAEAGLDRISAIGTNLTGTQLDLFVTTEGAPGVAQFTLDLSGLGALMHVTGSAFTGTDADDLIVTGPQAANVHGGTGDDIIVDGAGLDRLHGDAGADTFVLIDGDGERDKIFDYEFGIDTIDLSAWSMCYGTAWLRLQALSNGALRVTSGDNSFDVFAADGTDLTEADIARITLTFSSSYEVERAPLQEPAPNTGIELYGSGLDDTLTGSAGNDELHGGGGNDLLISGGGVDIFWGGSGMDSVSYAGTGPGLLVNLGDAALNQGAAAGHVYDAIEGVIGSQFADHITGNTLANRLEGGAGDDWLDGMAGDDMLFGGAGHDSLLGREGDDFIDGGDGNDNMAGAQGNDQIHGGAGNDQLGGGDGNDRLFGGEGHDWLGGGPGHDWLEGGAGDDRMSASYGNDSLYGGDGNDHIAAGPGADYVSGGAGNDNIGGGAGIDEIHCGGGNDTVGAGDGADRIWGNAGNDILNGGAGDDTIHGGSGQDRINGGAGDDLLTGGVGADTFVFATHGAGEHDVITDFNAAEGDLIQIAGVAGGSMTERFDALGATELGGDVLLTHGSHTIVLEDMALGNLDSGDFIFV